MTTAFFDQVTPKPWGLPWTIATQCSSSSCCIWCFRVWFSLIRDPWCAVSRSTLRRRTEVFRPLHWGFISQWITFSGAAKWPFDFRSKPLTQSYHLRTCFRYLWICRWLAVLKVLWCFFQAVLFFPRLEEDSHPCTNYFRVVCGCSCYWLNRPE